MNDRLLGQGGFGIVMTNARDDGTAHKLMKTHVTCKEAKAEHANHARIYAVFKRFIAAHPQYTRALSVPAALGFSSCTGCHGPACHACHEPYHCVYSMTRVRSGRRDGLMEHVILSEDDQAYTGKVFFVSLNQNAVPNSTYVNAALKRKGPRGAFLGLEQLQRRRLDPKKLARHMGILYQLVREAGLQPKDVEYVLGVPPRASGGAATCLWAMDFGMTNQPFTPQEMAFDMYIPKHGDRLYPFFEEGLELVRVWARRGGGGVRGVGFGVGSR